MTIYKFPFDFTEDPAMPVKGSLELDEPLPYRSKSQGGGFYRPAKIVLDDGPKLEIILYDCSAIAEFIYLHECPFDPFLLDLIGLNGDEIARKDIRIGDRVWIGRDVQVLKGTVLHSESVVGACSVVSRAFDEGNCVVAGVPARVVKQGIRWDRALL